MLIRSQNRGQVVVLENFISIEVTGKEIRVYRKNADNSVLLGKYCSRERALYVLDEICDKYQYLKECETIGAGASQPEFVYYMPKK